jgi:hypothetical protein
MIAPDGRAGKGLRAGICRRSSADDVMEHTLDGAVLPTVLAAAAF